MDQSKPRGLAALVGQNVRAAREEQGMSQDRLAQLLRGYGLHWTRSALAKLEREERETLTLDQVVILALAMERTPASLVEGAEWAALGPDARMRGSALARLLRGEPAWKSDSDFDVPFVRQFDEGPFDADWVAGDAETRAARRLGREPVEVARAARSLWRHSLTIERDRRLRYVSHLDEDVEARSVRAFRGHITRQLLDELRTELEKTNRRRKK
jgi:transcriptional regulator with XRE-family HTH domain